MTPKINWKPTDKDIRQFGWVLWVGFALIGAIVWWKGHAWLAKVFWGATSGILLMALAIPRAAKPFYWFWMGLGFVMGSIMSRVVLALIFFGLMTPIALFFRLAGRDVLRLQRPSPDPRSYWQDHPDIPKPNYARLF